MSWGQGPWPVTQFPQVEVTQKFMDFQLQTHRQASSGLWSQNTMPVSLPHSVKVKGRQDGEEEGTGQRKKCRHTHVREMTQAVDGARPRYVTETTAVTLGWGQRYSLVTRQEIVACDMQ